MNARTLLLALVLSVFCAQANAQVSFSTRSTGTISRTATLPGVLSATAGTPYTLEISSVFSEPSAWWVARDWIGSNATPSTASLTIGDAVYEFSGVGRMTLLMHNQTQAGIVYREVRYGVSFVLPGTGDSLSFNSRFYLDPQGQPATLMDLFDPASGVSVSTVAAHYSGVWLFPEGRIWGPELPGNPAAVMFSTTGVPIAFPVPEPSNAAMLMAGMALIAAIARRRRS